MTELSFSPRDIEAWGAFSGDRNPIHFDAAAAARAGLPGRVAHGMLCLLPVKQALDARRRPEAAPFVFKAYFRSPVPPQRPHQLTCAEGPRSRDLFSLSDAGDGRERMRGWLAPAAGQPPPAPAGARPLAWTPTRRSEFARLFPAVTAPWIGLDALAFSEFVTHDLAAVSAAALGQPAAPWETGTDLTVMQTSQELAVWPAALRDDVPEVLLHAVSDVSTVETDGEVAGSVQVTLWDRSEPLLQASYGLLARRRRADPHPQSRALNHADI